MKSSLKRLAIAIEEAALAVLFKRQCDRREAFYQSLRTHLEIERDPSGTLPVLATVNFGRAQRKAALAEIIGTSKDKLN